MKNALILLVALSTSFLPLSLCSGQVIFEDDFSSGNLNRWTILSGSWAVISGEMCATADGSSITPNTGTLTSYVFTTDARFESGLAWGIDFRYIDPGNRVRLDFAPGAPNQLNVNIYQNGSFVSSPYRGSCSQYGYQTQHYCKFVVEGSYFEVYFGNDPSNLDLLCSYTYPAFDSGTVRYEVWGYPPNVRSCFDNVRITGEDEWMLIYEEDFSTDPGWTTNNGSHFHWNPSEENYYVHIEDNLNEYGVIQVPEMVGSFKIEYDAKMTQNDWSSALIFGLYDDEIAYKPEPQPPIDTLSTLVLMFDRAGGGSGFTIHSYTPPLVCNYHNHWCGTSMNQWYHVVIEYDAGTSTASYEVTRNGNPVSSNSITISGAYRGLTYLGISRRWHHYVQGATTTGYVDNVELWATEQLVAPLTIDLTPFNPPIVIPQGGGAFAFNIAAANNSASAQTFDGWVNIEVPGGIQFTILGPVCNINLGAGSSMERGVAVFVPGRAPAGEYICLGIIGNHPWEIIDSDAFPFTKLGADGIWNGPESWICSGELFPGEIISNDKTLPEKSALHGAFPNPFNAKTVISCEWRVSSQVRLAVYDISGREVAVLAEGLYPAGTHQSVWDASSFPSGVYFACLTAGDFQRTRKLLLIK